MYFNVLDLYYLLNIFLQAGTHIFCPVFKPWRVTEL
jgi:hypothetical protein